MFQSVIYCSGYQHDYADYLQAENYATILPSEDKLIVTPWMFILLDQVHFNKQVNATQIATFHKYYKQP